MKKMYMSLAVVLFMVITGCSGGGGGDTAGGSSDGATSTGSNITVAQGQFIDSAVGGLNYSSGGQSGITDMNGTFTYEVGQPVTFAIGGIVIGTALGKATITPVDLVSGAEDHTNPTVTNIASFLQSLNAGGNPDNGITITETTRSLATGSSVNFNQSTSQFSQDNNVQSVVSNLTSANPGGAQQLVDATTAQNHLAASLSALSGGFNKGSHVMAQPPDGVNVRNLPSTNSLPLLYPSGQLAGVHGTVINTCASAGINCTEPWYQIRWDSDPKDSSSILAPQLPGWSLGSKIQSVLSTDDVQEPDLTNRYYQDISINEYATAALHPGPDNTNWRMYSVQDQNGESYFYSDSVPFTWTDGNTHYAYGNCTWYAYGRMLEKGYTKDKLTFALGHAYQWKDNANPSSVKTQPAVGAIAVFGKQFDAQGQPTFSEGHVAVVESVNDAEGTYTVTESTYGLNKSDPRWNFLWRRRTISKTAVAPRGFQYFILVSNSNKQNQTISPISFTPATLTEGGTAMASATASSGLQVTFSSKTDAVCSATAAGNVTGKGAGTCTIAANQAGNATYNAAAQVTGTIVVTGNSNSSNGTLFVNGNELTLAEGQWVKFIANTVMPQLAGERTEQIRVASVSTWWALKEGILDTNNPISFSICGSNNARLGPLEICDSGQAWQVGLAAVQVPNFTDSAVASAISTLWPSRTDADVLEEAINLAGFNINSDPGATIAASSGILRRSWLLRNPAVGITLVERNVTDECINSSKSWCYGTAWDTTNKYAPTRDAAMTSIADL